MHKIIPPLKLGMQGKDVANLLEALQFLLEKNIIGLSEREKRALQEDLSAEIKEQYYGQFTTELVRLFQKKFDLTTNREVDAQTAQMLNSIFEEFEPIDNDEEESMYRVEGVISSRISAAVGGLTIKILKKGIFRDRILAESVTDRSGYYHVDLYISNEMNLRDNTQPDFLVEVYVEDETIVASKIRYNASKKEKIDIVLDGTNSLKLRSEFETLTEAIYEYFPDDIAIIKEDKEQQQITYIANKIGWDARLVAMRVLAEKYHKKSGIFSPLFYALFRSELPSDLDSLYQTHSITVRNIWENAIDNNIIPSLSEEKLIHYRELFIKKSLDHLLRENSTLKEMLELTLQEKNRQFEFIKMYQTHEGDMETFWEKVEEQFHKNTTKSLQNNGKLGYLTFNNARLIKKLPAVSDPILLVEKGFYKPKEWEKLFDEETLPEFMHKDYSEYLAVCLRLAYPEILTYAIMDEFEFENIHLKESVKDFLKGNQFQIAMQSIDRFVQDNELIISDDVKNEIRRIQKFYHFMTSYSRNYLRIAPIFIKEIHSPPYYVFASKAEEKVISDVTITPFRQLMSGGRLVTELNNKNPFAFGNTKIQVQGNERTENIIGAFGLQLGDVFNPDDAINLSKTNGGEIVYQFEPTKKVKYFKTYYLLITPTSHKIKKIWGTGNYDNVQTCQDDKDVIQSILEKKYGKMKQSYLTNMLRDKPIFISSRTRVIELKCTNNFPSLGLYLEYKDNDLYELSSKEREKLKITDIDSSAL